MSVLDNQTKINPTTSFFGTGSGGGGSNFNIINVSTIDMEPNGDINWSEALNFQGIYGGGAILQSTVGGFSGLTPTTAWTLYSPNTFSELTTSIDSSGAAVITTPAVINLSSSTVQVIGDLGVSSINGGAYPPPAPTAPINSIAFGPNTNYTYVPAGGATVTIGQTPALSSQHFYHLSINFRFNLEPLTAQPNAEDNIGISFAGNFNSYPNNFTQSCALISSLQNDMYASYSAVLKANNNSPAVIQAYGAPAPAYSTSVGVETLMVITDLGAF